MLSQHQHMPEDFIRKFADRVDWCWISACQCLSEDFIREFADELDWECISSFQHLSEDFIREFADRVDWYMISVHQRLSEDFIREFSNRVEWDYISEYQNLSEDFIRDFSDLVKWRMISLHQRLSENFIKEFADKVNLSDVKDSWHYKDAALKKHEVEETGLYECHEDYFIAYKGIRRNRYSALNFQYRYLPGETYETFADYSDKEDSFGFSAWTEEKAREYCDELVVPCKICYRDVARVVHKGGKIRCSKITVLD